MKKALGSILFVLYAIIAITVTVLLLSYNDYNNSELGGYTVYIVKDDSLEPKYKQGSILLIKSTSDKNVQQGDEILLYKVINSQEYEVVDRTLKEKTQQGNHIIYAVEDEESYANEYFIGKTSDTVVLEGWGYVLNLLESKWGYLFCVVIVSLLLFLQEVFDLVMEIKYLGEKKKKKEQKKAVEVEYKNEEDEIEDVENEDEDEFQEVKVVKKAPTKKTSTSTKTTSKKTGGTTKATSTNKTPTKKASTASKSTTKKTTTTTKKVTKTESTAKPKKTTTRKTTTKTESETKPKKTTTKTRKSAKEEE